MLMSRKPLEISTRRRESTAPRVLMLSVSTVVCPKCEIKQYNNNLTGVSALWVKLVHSKR